MNTKLTSILLVSLLLMSTILAACSSEKKSDTPAKTGKKIVVGVLAREQPDLEYVAEKLKQDGFEIEARVFNDNIAINTATEDGSIDANYFQNERYLNSFNSSKNTHLITYGPSIFTTPVLLVSKKFKSVEELPKGAKIGIANDAANRARELQLLVDNGVIKLKEGAELPTLLDITENPKDLEFVETDPRNRVGIFPDLDAMTAPSITVYQMKDPEVTVDTALLAEKPEVYKTYGGTLFVVHESKKDLEWLDKAIEIMTSKEYSEWLLKTYSGVKKPLTD
ncbi:MetQ/NlpA family ABC transporter substrate-binding protein [Paenibacillus eucommiae]|uniref:D-methionine transport system substrate-binding protein n=1 Tax=Paenibacillus eucommiae TaxID=1355755 RepID=A0ABS4IYL8_9BACL|nr:MetQ/NlpA family ABC transporter substrate-binding protein [Paenibacillus eucommiae]MBP1991634.1 D-methionine transport system substrate-binding protein [Paenibacillus eucommiae]